MNFFQELYELMDGVDITIHFKRKNDRLTLSVLPKTTGNIAPALITGTPEELQQGFIDAVKVPIEQAKGLQVELDHFNKSMQKEKQKEHKAAAEKPAEKKQVEKETPKAKAPEKKPIELPEPLF